MQRQSLSLNDNCEQFKKKLKFINMINQPKQDYINVVVNNIKAVKQLLHNDQQSRKQDAKGEQYQYLKSQLNNRDRFSEEAQNKKLNSRRMIPEQNNQQMEYQIQERIQQYIHNRTNLDQLQSRSNQQKLQREIREISRSLNQYPSSNNMTPPTQLSKNINQNQIFNDEKSDYSDQLRKQQIQNLASQLRSNDNLSLINSGYFQMNNETNPNNQLNRQQQNIQRSQEQVKQNQKSSDLFTQSEILLKIQIGEAQQDRKQTGQINKKEQAKTQQKQFENIKQDTNIIQQNQNLASFKQNPSSYQLSTENKNDQNKNNQFNQQKITLIQEQNHLKENIQSLWIDDEIVILTEVLSTQELRVNQKKQFFQNITFKFNQLASQKGLPQRTFEQILERIKLDAYAIYKNDKQKNNKIYKDLLDKSSISFA